MKKTKKDIDSGPNAVTSEEAGNYRAPERLLKDRPKPNVAPGEDRVSADLTRRPRRGEFRERFQRFMAAAAFAESGEAGTALDIAYTQKKTSKVLLAIDGSDLNKDAFRYATNLCRRMDASLDVLRVIRQRPGDTAESLKASSASQSEEVKKILQQVSGNRVPVHVSVTRGELDKEVYSYAKDNKDVVAVVFESPHVHREEPERGKWQRILQSLSKRLAIPMITAESKVQVGSLRGA